METTDQDILHFWFEEINPQLWFAKDENFDELIRQRFQATFHAAMSGQTSSWRQTPEGRLAEILVLDQFPRNMFRGKPESFSGDPFALKLAQEAVAVGADFKIPTERRGFVYMPYMHSEDPLAHEAALHLFSQKGLENNLKFEILHKKIIDRFGRYPHRNAVLGRPSTPEEIEFLKEPGSSF